MEDIGNSTNPPAPQTDPPAEGHAELLNTYFLFNILRHDDSFRYASPMPGPAYLLFIDTASPVVSVALGADSQVVAAETIELRSTSERLLPTIETMLEQTGVALQELSGLVAFRGPGSFTGLRIGLATVLGLHQALALRATAIDTLHILALASDPSTAVTAAVDALRGDWFAQTFASEGDAGTTRVSATSQAGLASGAELLTRPSPRLIGFGIERLAETPGYQRGQVELIEPPPLAAVAARHLAPVDIDWQPSRLTTPIYFRQPAVTLPKGSPRL